MKKWEKEWFEKRQKEHMECKGNRLIECLDILGLALADEGHVWTSKERKAYEEGIELCKE